MPGAAKEFDGGQESDEARKARAALPFHRTPTPSSGTAREAPMKRDRVAPLITIVLRGEPEGRKQPVAGIARPKGKKPFVVFYPAKETAAYQKALAMQAKVVMGSRPLLSGAVAVAITAVFAVPSSWTRRDRDAALVGTIRPTGKPDADNLLKQLDAFKNVVWTDDALVVDARVIKIYGEEPMLRVEVEPLEGQGGLFPAIPVTEKLGVASGRDSL